MEDNKYICDLGFIMIWCTVQVNSFWDVFLSLPLEQQNWEASHKLRIGISDYKLILPVFMKLHSQVRSG